MFVQEISINLFYRSGTSNFTGSKGQGSEIAVDTTCNLLPTLYYLHVHNADLFFLLEANHQAYVRIYSNCNCFSMTISNKV